MRTTPLSVLLLAAACMLAAPWRAHAGPAPAGPSQDAAPAASVQTRAHGQALNWSSLSPAQQRMLAPLRDQWDRMRPARQHRLAGNAQRWATLPPGRRQQVSERLTRWAQMTPEQRRQLQENARAFRELSPEERAKVRAAYQKFQSLPPAQRRALRERWRSMSPAQRLHWTNTHPAGSTPAHPGASHRR